VLRPFGKPNNLQPMLCAPTLLFLAAATKSRRNTAGQTLGLEVPSVIFRGSNNNPRKMKQKLKSKSFCFPRALHIQQLSNNGLGTLPVGRQIGSEN